MAAKLTPIQGGGAPPKTPEQDADLAELEDILLVRTKEILKTKPLDPDDAAIRQIELKTMGEAAKVLSAVVSSRRARRPPPSKSGEGDGEGEKPPGGLGAAFG